MNLNSINNDTALFENSIRYLHNLTSLDPQTVPPLLRSFYTTKCRLMELRRRIYLPSVLTKTSVRCQRCFLNYSDGPTKYRVEKVKKTNYAKKILGKVFKDKPLTKYQRKYLKSIKQLADNHKKELNQLKISCNFCKKDCAVTLTKPEKLIWKTPLPKTIKKKKKRNDKYCGLNKNAIIFSSTPKKKLEKPELDESKSNIENKKTFSSKQHHIRSFDTADFIPLKTKKPKLKISKKQKIINTVKPVDQKTQKKNLKNLNKLSNVLKNVNQPRKSANLQDFLKSL